MRTEIQTPDGRPWRGDALALDPMSRLQPAATRDDDPLHVERVTHTGDALLAVDLRFERRAEGLLGRTRYTAPRQTGVSCSR